MKIDNFSGEYRFLSNFYMHNIEYEGIVYPSTEHAFQAAKSLDPLVRLRIKQAKTCGQAKKMGRDLKLRPDWENVKINVMLDVLRTKFQDEELKQELIDTGSAELIEANTWNDQVWGVCDGKGQNWLGRLLMQVRDEINESKQAK